MNDELLNRIANVIAALKWAAEGHISEELEREAAGVLAEIEKARGGCRRNP